MGHVGLTWANLDQLGPNTSPEGFPRPGSSGFDLEPIINPKVSYLWSRFWNLLWASRGSASGPRPRKSTTKLLKNKYILSMLARNVSGRFGNLLGCPGTILRRPMIQNMCKNHIPKLFLFAIVALLDRFSMPSRQLLASQEGP